MNNTQIIDIGEGFHLSPIQATDKPAYLQHFADPEIGRTMLALPFPYTETDADWWIAHRLNQTGELETQFAIRSADGSLIGGIGIVEELAKDAYRGEIGYWLGRIYRGRGLMPRVIRVFADYSSRNLKLHKLTAITYPFNPASSRALEKAGFTLEGCLRSHCRLRNADAYTDALVYGLIL